MRLFAIITVMLSLVSSNVLAAGAEAPSAAEKSAAAANGPLAPGKPAGVTKAQQFTNTELVAALGLGAAGIILLATGGGSDSVTQTSGTTGTH